MAEGGDVRIVLDDLTPHNIKQFKKINQSVFPVQYNDQFYKDALNSDIHFSKLAYFNDLVVGAVCFRLEDSAAEAIGIVGAKTKAETIKAAEVKRAYIMTLGCLTPYRRYGVGRKMLNWVKQKAKELCDVNGIFLHVQINNDAAKQFYENQEFTQIGDVQKDYYKRVDPADAFMLSMPIEVTKKEEPVISEKENTSPASAKQEDSKLTSPPASQKKPTPGAGGGAGKKNKHKKGKKKR